MYLHSFRPVLPARRYSQSFLNDWVVNAHLEVSALQGERLSSVDEKKLRSLCIGEDKISARYLDAKETPFGLDTEERSLIFKEIAVNLFDQFYEGSISIPDHLIHVTCTGYVSPSPSQIYFSNKNVSPAITHAYHMGCYASLPAVRIAMGLSTLDQSRIDIVHTEICSLHFNPRTHDAAQMIVQSLFADGHIKYSASAVPKERSFRVISIKEEIIPNSVDDMTWMPGSYGMKMTLSREVPFKIGRQIKRFVNSMTKDLDISKYIFAIHPGGPKIIESIKEILSLSEEQVRFSRKVLFERGNMSSATLPHVWKEILEGDIPKNSRVISLAFGPGLTIFGGIFETSH